MGWEKHTMRRGFTIVELLIVVVVIGILAAITVVAYNGIQNRAYDVAIQSDLRSFVQKWGLYTADDDLVGASSNEVREKIETFEWKASRDAYDTTDRNLVLCLNHTATSAMNPNWGTDGASRKNWALVVLSKSGNIYYASSERSAPTRYTGSTPMVFDATELVCGVVINELGADGFTSVHHGYMASDSTTGPWRVWAGGPS